MPFDCSNTPVLSVVVVVVVVALLRSAVMCIRGCRSKTKRPITNNGILLASAESGLSYC